MTSTEVEHLVSLAARELFGVSALAPQFVGQAARLGLLDQS